MTEELNAKIEILEGKVELLTQKLNEVISCLEDNELSRKVTIDYIYNEGVEGEEKPEEETAEEEAEETPSK